MNNKRQAGNATGWTNASEPEEGRAEPTARPKAKQLPFSERDVSDVGEALKQAGVVGAVVVLAGPQISIFVASRELTLSIRGELYDLTGHGTASPTLATFDLNEAGWKRQLAAVCLGLSSGVTPKSGVAPSSEVVSSAGASDLKADFESAAPEGVGVAPTTPPSDDAVERELAAHPAAAIFPMLAPEELRDLAADIKAHGLRVPIVLHEDQVLDGRNRLAACRLAAVVPTFIAWDGQGGTPANFVISMNLKRRHLTSSQAAVVAMDAVPILLKEQPPQNFGDGADRHDRETAAVAAAAFGTNREYVRQALAMRRVPHGKDILQAVREGKISMPDGSLISQLPVPERAVALKKELKGERLKRFCNRHDPVVARARERSKEAKRKAEAEVERDEPLPDVSVTPTPELSSATDITVHESALFGWLRTRTVEDRMTWLEQFVFRVHREVLGEATQKS